MKLLFVQRRSTVYTLCTVSVIHATFTIYLLPAITTTKLFVRAYNDSNPTLSFMQESRLRRVWKKSTFEQKDLQYLWNV